VIYQVVSSGFIVVLAMHAGSVSEKTVFEAILACVICPAATAGARYYRESSVAMQLR
jgi:hypothetical protein